MKDNFAYIWIGWLIFGLAAFLFFRFYKNAKVKRIAFPVVQVVVTAAFLIFVWNMWEAEIGPMFFLFSGFAILIGISNFLRTAFCDSCGAMSYSNSLIKPPTSCSSCGSKWV